MCSWFSSWLVGTRPLRGRCAVGFLFSIHAQKPGDLVLGEGELAARQAIKRDLPTIDMPVDR